jgi:plasmid stabilization system protein ParE
MTRELVIEPEAEAEIIESADWYEARNPEARTGFLNALDRTLDYILERPEQYQVVYRETRRAVLDGYPFAVFYKVTDSQIIIVSCFHTSRDPKAWRDRLR